MALPQDQDDVTNETGADSSKEAVEASEAQDTTPQEATKTEDLLVKLKIEDLERKVADYETKISSIRTYVKNLESEMEQARLRAQRDQQRLVDQKLSHFFRDSLQVMDNFDLCLKSAASEKGPLVDGLKMIHQQMTEVFKSAELVRLQTKGEVFNPEIHEAITTVPVDSEDKDGIIVDELKSGYRFKDAIIRPAQVIVGKKSS